MADSISTAGDLRRIAQFLSGISDAADQLEKIGGLENAINELNKQRDQAVVDKDDANARRDAAKALTEDALSQSKIIEDDAQKYATQLQSDANDKAKVIIDTSNLMASQILDKANSDAQAIDDSINSKLAILRAEIADCDATLIVRHAEVDGMTAKAAEAEARLASVQAQIAKMLGGA